MRDAIIKELEALPKEAGAWSTPVYEKDFGSHRWGCTGISARLHNKNWTKVIEIIKEVDPEFYARYTIEQDQDQASAKYWEDAYHALHGKVVDLLEEIKNFKYSDQ